jgi:hypothetical protein
MDVYSEHRELYSNMGMRMQHTIFLMNSGCQTYELKSLNLFLLMYADDTVLLSEDVDDLQKMINSLH